MKCRIQSDATVVLNDKARVEAEVSARCVVVHGQVVGNVTASDRIEVGATGRIKGEVKAGSARVTEGGVLDGRCAIVPPGERTPEARPTKPLKAPPPAEEDKKAAG